MALDPLEWVSIAAIGIVIFLWGPDKIPEIARSLRSAKKTFDSASKEFQAMTSELKNPPGILAPLAEEPTMSVVPRAPAAPTAFTVNPSPNLETNTSDRTLIDNARGLGILTEGKTKEQISQEILAKGKGAE